MMRSDNGALSAHAGRGGIDAAASSSDEYRVLLPRFPDEKMCLNSVFLHADLMGRPYRAVDFRDGLKDIVDMTNVVSIGQFQMSHIWMISLASMAATENMKRIGQLTVKGRKCLVLDANAKDIRVRPEQPATTSQKTHGPYLCHRRLGMILPWSKAVTATVLLHLRSWASETKVKSSKQVPFPRVKGTEWTQTLLWELVSVTSNERNWNRGPHTQVSA
ncbi:hypothetical protein ISCGN_011943 [Ixodes scapularis]